MRVVAAGDDGAGGVAVRDEDGRRDELADGGQAFAGAIGGKGDFGVRDREHGGSPAGGPVLALFEAHHARAE